MSEKFKYQAVTYPEPSPLHYRYDIQAAYLLWFITGYAGGHHFYLKRHRRAFIHIGLSLLTLVSILTPFSLIPFLALTVLMIRDFFTLRNKLQTLNIKAMRENGLNVSQNVPEASVAA